MNHIRDYVNSLDEQEVLDIVYTYEQCIEHNWTIVEETPHIRHTKLFLEKYGVMNEYGSKYRYSDMLVRECYRVLALNYIGYQIYKQNVLR